MYPAILSYDEQLVPSQVEVEQVKKHGGFRPQRKLPRKRLKTPDSEVAEDRLMKDIIK